MSVLRRWFCTALAVGLTSAVLAEPVIVHISDPVGPGQAATLIGHDLGTQPQARAIRLADPPVGPDQPEGLVGLPAPRDLTVVQGGPQSLKLLVPADSQPGVWSVAVSNGQDTAGCLLNAPVIWWAQGDQGRAASPGGWLRLFGKCLGWTDAGAPKALVVLQQGQTKMALTPVTTPWSARLELPRNLSPGRWQLTYHHGRGGATAWTKALTIEVVAPATWPPTVYSVKDFGADGSGARDDTAAVESALAKAAAAGGGVVFFPRGRYLLSRGLTIPRFTVLRGERTDWVNLAWPDVETPPDVLLKGTNSFAIENLTIYATRHRHVIAGDLGNVADAGHVRLWRVRVRANAYRGHLTEKEVDERLVKALKFSTGGADTVRLGGDDVRIVECDFYGSGRALFLSRVRGGQVRRNHFYNGRWGWYCISGSDGLIFEDNDITGADLMSTGGGLNCLDGSTYSQNVWYAANRLKLMHGWDREAMTSDAGGGLYYGRLAAVDGLTLKLPEAPNAGRRDWTGAGVFVFSGTGWGQVRRVTRVDGDRVTIDRPWDVAPDSGSLVGITMLQQHYLLVGNDFSDAGIAVQFYGCSIEHIVANNTCARAGGYQSIGKPYGGYQLPPDRNPCHQPSWYCQFLDNTIAEGGIYRSGANNSILSGDSVIGVFGWPLTGNWPWPYNVGAVVRGNRLLGNARIHIGSRDGDQPTVRDVVVEQNLVSDADEGIRVDRATAGVLVRDNTLRNLREPLAGNGMAAAWVAPEQRASAELVRVGAAGHDAGVATDPLTWPGVAAAHQALKSAPVGSPAAREAADRLLEAALTHLAKPPAKLSYASLAALVGLRVEVLKESTLPSVLQSARGGLANLDVAISLQRSRPGWRVQSAYTLPPGWNATVLGPTDLVDGKARFPLPAEVPAGAWGRHVLDLLVVLHLPEVSCSVSTPVAVGSGKLRDWMVIGPFPNRTAQPLDLSLNPPDEGLDLKVAYDVAGRKLSWQPVHGGDWLDLNALYRTQEPGVAYAVACLEAEREQQVVLQLGGTGGLAVMLNGSYVWSRNSGGKATADQERVPLTLRAGDNVLLLKLSTVTKDWKFAAEVLPTGDQFAAKLRPAAPETFAGRAAFAPPPPAPALADGELRFPAGVRWQLRCGDDFGRDTLGGRWRVGAGDWQCQGGLLMSGNGQAFLAYAEPFKAPVRIEYDCRLASGQPSDMSAFWLRNPADYASGWLIGFGSNGNTVNKVLVNGSQDATSERPLAQPGKTHHVIAQILPDGRVQLIVDGQLSLEHRGPVPTEALSAGVWSWGAPVLFSKVRIYSGP